MVINVLVVICDDSKLLVNESRSTLETVYGNPMY